VAERLCLGCRKRQHQHQMIPLGLNPEGSLVVWTDHQRVWVCQRRQCLTKLAKRPGPLQRRLGRRAKVDKLLLQSAEAWRINRISQLLQQAHRQGLLIVGTKKTIDLVEKLSAICLSQNAGTQTRDRFVSGNWPDKTFILPLSSGQIGALFARGPRTVVGIRSGRTTQSLLEGLRMWDSLG